MDRQIGSASTGRSCCGIGPNQLSRFGSHALSERRGRRTLLVAVEEAEVKEEVDANFEEIY